MKKLLVVLFVLILMLISRNANAAFYDVVPIDTFGGYITEAYEVNDSGQVAGWSYFPAGNCQAYRWDSTNGMQDLGGLHEPWSFGYGINGSGQVVGSTPTTAGPTRPWHAYVWDNTNGMVDIGTLGGDESHAYSINDRGQIVGMSNVAPSTLPVPFLWDNVNGMQSIGTLGGNYGEAYGINEKGQVVGWAQDNSGMGQAFVWDNTNGMQDIGNLGGNYGVAFGINESGMIAGFSGNSEGEERAFLWNGEMLNLGTLGGKSYAEDLNDLGYVVGYSFISTDLTHAFIWDSSNNMQDLNNLIDPSSGWVLEAAVDINNSGYIVGKGTLDGQNRAFLLKENSMNPVPEPSTILLLGFGLSGLGLLRRKR